MGEALGALRETLSELALEHVRGEVQHRVAEPFEADRRAGLGAHSLAAQRTFAVGREDLHAVRQPTELVVERLVQVLDLFADQFGAGQVGPADVAYEEAIAGQHQPRFFAAGAIRYEDRQGVRGVTGGFEDIQLGGAELEHIPLLDGDEIKFDRRPFKKMNSCPGAGLQFHVAAHVVGMDVGFEDVGDLHAVVAGDVDVILNIALGVHHTGDPGLGAADDVRQAPHALNSDLFEIHSGSSCKSPVVGFSGSFLLEPFGSAATMTAISFQVVLAGLSAHFSTVAPPTWQGVSAWAVR